jgi:hypothetical protein
MSIHLNIHVTPKQHLDVRSLPFNSEREQKAKFVTVDLRVSDSDNVIKLFLSNIEDVDRLAFEFENLSRSLREDEGWTTSEA